jgi:hypothetical protein
MNIDSEKREKGKVKFLLSVLVVGSGGAQCETYLYILLWAQGGVVTFFFFFIWITRVEASGRCCLAYGALCLLCFVSSFCAGQRRRRGTVHISQGGCFPARSLCISTESCRIRKVRAPGLQRPRSALHPSLKDIWRGYSVKRTTDAAWPPGCLPRTRQFGRRGKRCKYRDVIVRMAQHASVR